MWDFSIWIVSFDTVLGKFGFLLELKNETRQHWLGLQQLRLVPLYGHALEGPRVPTTGPFTYGFCLNPRGTETSPLTPLLLVAGTNRSLKYQKGWKPRA